MMHGWGGGIWMGLWMLVFWGGIIALVASAIRGGSSGRTGVGHRAPHAGEILEERFARGEISEEEFLGQGQVLASQRR
jgi:putative membrane protein